MPRAIAQAATSTHLQHIAGTREHVELITACLGALEMFRVSRQLDVLDDLLAGHSDRKVAAS